MAGYILLGVLAAFGALSLFWTLLGWLLPSGQGCALVCFGAPEEGIYTRWKWLRGMGFLCCPLLIVGEESPGTWADTEICAGEALLSRLEWERNRFDGTGNGDPAGRHQRRDISEL